jgi:hypothetical protein
MLGGAVAGSQSDRAVERARSLRIEMAWCIRAEETERWRATLTTLTRHPHGRRATLTVGSQEKAANLLA